MTDNPTLSETNAKTDRISLRGAVFIGIGSMVGAGIFALFGEAGTIAGAAVWVSFLIGGIVDWIVRGYGSGLFTGGVVVLGYFAYIIVAAMVAVSFGNYATELLLGAGAAPIWPKVFAAGILILLTLVNLIGAETVSRAQTIIVSVVLVVLVGFAVAMLVQINPSLLAPSTYPPMSYIMASVALTFFAYLGFGVIAFTGGDLENPKKNMPRAMYIALGFTLALYVALAIGVFGTLTVEEVIANADTALAAAALPIFGALGYTMISIAAVFATMGATNSQLYATLGASYAMAKDGHLPPVFGKHGHKRPGGAQGLVISSLIAVALAVFFDLGAIASLGSAVALLIYVLITIAHFRLANETGASKIMLTLALITTSVAILVFAWYTLRTDPRTFAILVVTIVLAWVVEAIWRSISKRKLEVTASETDTP